MVATGRIALYGVFCALCLALSSCMQQTNETVLAEIGPEKMSIADYERLLTKSNGNWETAKNLPLAEKEKFLDLLVKFRLKLLDAYRQGLDGDPEIKQEMKEYRNTLAASFLFGREIVAPGLRLMYQRHKEEIRASHILIGLGPNPTGQDTLSAWQKASEVIRRLQSGEDFAKLAKQFSEDYNSREIGGDLYYFTSGIMMAPFEDACYQLHPGEVFPEPVRTQYGYHVIKVTDRKSNPGQIRASHIMIRFETVAPTLEDTLKAYNQIKAFQDSLAAGRDFALLAKSYSQDTGSAQASGDLGFFERRQTVQPFDEAAFSLKVGEVSKIVRTPYGYHLIKVTEEKRPASFREIKQTLRQIYQNNRYAHDYANFLHQYKAAVKFKFHEEVVDTLLSCADPTKTFANQTWDQKIPPIFRQKAVFSYAEEMVTLDSVITVMKRDAEFSRMELRKENIHQALDRIAERHLVRHRTRDIESEHPEFIKALREYEEGVLLYKSEQQRVWSKLSATDSLLRDYFEQHRDRYSFPDRVNLSEIYIVADSNRAGQLLDSLKSGIDFSELAARQTERVVVRGKKGEWGLRPTSESILTQTAAALEIGQISGVLPFQEGFSIIKVLGKEKARPKTYEEALPELSGHYHEDMSARLENEWLDRLRQDFRVSVWKERLTEAFTKPPRDEEE